MNKLPTRKPRRPRLTKAVIEGLRACRSVISVELESGDAGEFVAGDYDYTVEGQRALDYIDALIVWFKSRH